MDVFFQFIAAFALFFGIAGLVYGTEVSKRCQQQINTRLAEIETRMARKIHQQDQILEGAIIEMRRSLKGFEENQQMQSREIVAIRKALEPIADDLEKRIEERKAQEELAKRHRRRS